MSKTSAPVVTAADVAAAEQIASAKIPPAHIPAVTLDASALVKDAAVLLGFNSGRTMQALADSYASLIKGADDIRLNQIRDNFMLGAVAERLFPGVTAKQLTAAHISAASLARTTKTSAQTPEQVRANGAARKRWHTVLKLNDVDAPASNGGGDNGKKVKADAPKADAQSVTTTEPVASSVTPSKKGYATVAEGHAKLVADLAAIRADMDKWPTAFTSNHIKIIDSANRALNSLKIEE
jgi:hypothetical protein